MERRFYTRIHADVLHLPEEEGKHMVLDSVKGEEWRGQTYVQAIVFARQLEGHPPPGDFTPRVQGPGDVFAGLCVEL